MPDLLSLLPQVLERFGMSPTASVPPDARRSTPPLAPMAQGGSWSDLIIPPLPTNGGWRDWVMWGAQLTGLSPGKGEVVGYPAPAATPNLPVPIPSAPPPANVQRSVPNMANGNLPAVVYSKFREPSISSRFLDRWPTGKTKVAVYSPRNNQLILLPEYFNPKSLPRGMQLYGFLAGSGQPVEIMRRKARRMNPENGRAAVRAARRLTMVAKHHKRIQKALKKAIPPSMRSAPRSPKKRKR